MLIPLLKMNDQLYFAELQLTGQWAKHHHTTGTGNPVLKCQQNMANPNTGLSIWRTLICEKHN